MSVNAAGNTGPYVDIGVNDEPKVSDDGRFVAFVGIVSNQTSTPDTNGVQDVFLRDMHAGTTSLVSINATGTAAGNGGAINPSLSANGRFVVFYSNSSDLVPNDAYGGVFVRDMVAGTTTLVNVNAAGTGSSNGGAIFPVMSPDGRFVAFDSSSTDLMPNFPFQTPTQNVFVRDLVAGTTELISVNAAGTGTELASVASISADGQRVAFLTSGSDLGPTDTNGAQDVYVGLRVRFRAAHDFDDPDVSAQPGARRPAVLPRGVRHPPLYGQPPVRRHRNVHH